MAVTGVSTISMHQLMLTELQEYLGAETIFMNTIWDLSSTVEPGAVDFSIPRITGGSVASWPTGGAAATEGGVTVAVDKCDLDQYKQYSIYIEDAERAKTSMDLDDLFYEVAPSKIGDLIETFIYSELKKASATTPDNIFQLTGASNLVPLVADLFTIAQMMDTLNIPKADRFVAMGPAAYYSLIQNDAIINGSKSLSNEALINGAFSKVAGLTLLYGTNVTAGEVLAYQRKSLAFAFANGNAISTAESRLENEFRDFRAMKAIYGAKILDSGKRVILGNATGAA